MLNLDTKKVAKAITEMAKVFVQQREAKHPGVYFSKAQNTGYIVEWLAEGSIELSLLDDGRWVFTKVKTNA